MRSRSASTAACVLAFLAPLATAWARCADAPWPPRFEATVVRVKDGDSLVVRHPGGYPGPQERTLRLYGVDAPEFDQPAGAEARAWLRERARGERLAFEVVATDRYCRLLVRAAPAQRAREADALNLALVGAGWAWAEPHLSDERYRRAERAARAARRGLWADPAPVPPAQWRRQRMRAGAATP